MIDPINIFKKAEPKINQTIAESIPQIRTKNKYLGEICTTSESNINSPRNMITVLKNKFGKTLGYEDFNIEKENGKATGLMIWVDPEYRQKNYRFGEILRLSSIIMMIQNNIKKLEIFSKSSAVFFHHKYKFEPSIMFFSERRQVLGDMIQNCKDKIEYEDIYNSACKIQKRDLIETDSESQRKLNKEVNDLLKVYMKRVAKKNDYESHKFNSGMWMTLSNEKIQQNKDFFNELYKKHGIDYNI